MRDTDTSIELSSKKWLGIDHESFIQSWDLLNSALASGAPFIVLTYEGMQQTATQSLLRLGTFSGWPLALVNSTTAKVSSEDLQESISNFDQMENGLKQKQCFLDMLYSTPKQIMPLCSLTMKK
jgi:hypothetical protein